MASDSKPSPAGAAPLDARSAAPHQTSFGAFKPEGHVLLCFPDARTSAEARRRLLIEGVPDALMQSFSDEQMLRQAEEDLARASAIAEFGQEINLLRFQRDASRAGSHWLLVRAGDESEARRVAHSAEALGATLAQYYGSFLILELIQPPRELHQRTESPASGLDAGQPHDSSEPP